MIKILADIYSYYGSIVDFSSELASQGFYASNLIEQDPLPWKTTASTYHYVTGSLDFKETDSGYVCPINSLVILGHTIPVGSTLTLSIYSSLYSAPTQVYTLTSYAGDMSFMDLDITSGFYYKLEINLTSSQSIKITHLLVGTCWSPTRGIDANSYEICAVGSGKRLNLRNGSTFVQPTVKYRRQKITINELNKTDAFGFVDITSNYGKSSSIFIYLLEGTSLFTVSTFYGRMIEWSPITPSSVSADYKVSFTIEESK